MQAQEIMVGKRVESKDAEDDAVDSFEERTDGSEHHEIGSPKKRPTKSRRKRGGDGAADVGLLVESGMKRKTRAPSKIASSPVRIGRMRTSPGSEISLRLRKLICDPESGYNK